MLLKNILNLIKKHDNIFIFHHTRPDGDCIGSQQGLAKILQQNFPEKNIFCIGNDQGQFAVLDIEMFLPDQIEQKYLENALAIAVDLSESSRIENLEFFFKFKTRIRFDHHVSKSDLDFDLTLNIAKFVACCEVIFYFATKLNLKISKSAAECLYLGLLTDSGRFNFQSTSPETFIMASKIASLIDIQKIHAFLNQRDSKELKFNAYVYQNYQTYKNKINYFYADEKILEKFQIDSNSNKYLNPNILANIDKIHRWAFFVDIKHKGKNKIRVRIRSQNTPVRDLAEKYQGGGHLFAAGATLENKTEIENLLEDFANLKDKE